jgi:RNA methyltransferase, TrmH family
MTRAAPIDSAHNRHVAAARSLLSRKGRTAASAFLAEGPHAVAAALAAPTHDVREIFVTDHTANRETELVRQAAARAVPLRVVSERVLAGLQETVTPQGVVAVVTNPDVSLPAAVTPAVRLLAVLDQIADPGNAGTVIRTADAAGADAVLATSGSVDLWSGKCVRSSAGSVFHLPLVADVSIEAALGAAREQQAQILCTAADGTDDLDDLIDTGRLGAPTAWVFGNEAHGISDAARRLADRVVRVPVYGGAESLNLAAAAAVCLYASARALRRTERTDH